MPCCMQFPVWELRSCKLLRVGHTHTHTHTHTPAWRSRVTPAVPNPSVSNLLYKSIKKGRGRQWQRIRLPVQETKETWVQSLGWEDPLEPDCISSVLPGKSHGQRSLVGCSPWGCKESGMTERLRTRACRKAGISPPGQSANTGLI